MERDTINNIEQSVTWLTTDEFVKVLKIGDNIRSQAKSYVHNYTMKGVDGVEWHPYENATENQCIALYSLKKYIGSLTEAQFAKFTSNNIVDDLSSEFCWEPAAFLNYCFWKDKYPVYKSKDELVQVYSDRLYKSYIDVCTIKGVKPKSREEFEKIILNF